jgi:hypothetical protein
MDSVPSEAKLFPDFVPFFEQALGLVSGENLHRFLEAAIVTTGARGARLWLPPLESSASQESAEANPFVDHFAPIVVPIFARSKFPLPPEGADALVPFLVADFRAILKVADTRLHDSYDSQPNDEFLQIYEVVQKIDSLPALLPFVALAERRLEQLLNLLRKGCGVFDRAWIAWEMFIEFHSFILQKLDINVCQSWTFPEPWANFNDRYATCVKSPPWEHNQAVKAFENFLHGFEAWLHETGRHRPGGSHGICAEIG